MTVLPQEFDYYAILNVPRDASQEHITIAYRKLAIKCHPLRDKCLDIAFNPPEGIDDEFPFPPLTEQANWSYINQAYDTLSNPLRREIFDRYGVHGLRRGVALPNGYFEPYKYHGDYMKTYNEVFSRHAPYLNLIDASTNPPPLYSNETGIGVKVKGKPIEKIIQLDLREIFYGAVKRMQILRHEFIDGDKSKTEIREKNLMVPIAAGTEVGTRIIFKEEGDRYATKIPCDIIFITEDKPHEIYQRQQDDLHMNYKINLKQAMCGFMIKLETIDERKLSIPISDIVPPGYVKEIQNEGLPILNKKHKKGNLYIHFEVKFPERLTRASKSKFATWFKEMNAENCCDNLK